MGKKSRDETKTLLEEAGFEVLGTKGGKSTSHVRYLCSYKGYEFVFASSNNTVDSDPRWLANHNAIIKRIRRAIDTKNETLLRKYLNLRE